MIWSFAGYLSAFYLFAATYAAFTLPEHSRPLLGSLPIFVIAPLFLYGPTLEGLVSPDDAGWEKLNRLFDKGQLTIRSAYLGGLLCGLISHSLGLGIGAVLYWQLGMSWWLLTACVPLYLGAFVAQSWVLTRADLLDPESKCSKN